MWLSFDRDNFLDNLPTYVISILFGVVLGVVSLLSDPRLVLLGIISLIGVAFISRFPAYGVFGILISVATIFDHSNLFKINIIGTVDLLVIDVFFALLLVKIFIDWLTVKDYQLRMTRVGLFLLVFAFLGLIATFRAIIFTGLEFQDANSELRLIFYYLIFFVVLNLFTDPKTVKQFITGFHVLACIVGILMLIQFLAGPSVQILPGRVEELRTATETADGVVRVLPPGQSLILVSFVIQLVYLTLDGIQAKNWFSFMVIVFTGIGIVISFNRNFWVVVCLSIVMLYLFVDQVGRRRIIRWLIVTMPLLLLMLIAILIILPRDDAPPILTTTLGRFFTLGSTDILEEGSLQFRAVENNYALESLSPPSVLGSGMGTAYRPWDSRLDYVGDNGEAVALNHYIHNGHFWILLKIGLLGYACFMAYFLYSIWRGFRYWKYAPTTQTKSTVLGFSIVMVGLLVVATVNPIFMQTFWVVVFAIFPALIEVIIRMSFNEADNQQLATESE